MTAAPTPDGAPGSPRPAGAGPAAVQRDAGRIADLVMSMIRSHGALRTKVAGGLESDAGQVWLLVALAKLGPRRAGALAEQMCADPSTVSRQVAALVRAGLVERRSDPGDGRASLLAITDAGRERVGAFVDTRAQAVAPVVGDWSQPDREMFIVLLERYLSGLEQHRDAVVERFRQALHQPAAATAVAVVPLEREPS